MEILVDRFLRTRNGLVFDLASGSEIVFTRWAAGAGREHSAWVDRCAALAGIRHPHLVELVDYGLIGAAHRFEALGMPRARRPWPARDAATQAALRSVVSFLHERRMSAGRIGWARVVDLHGKPALEPNHRTGAPWPDVCDGSDEDAGKSSPEGSPLDCVGGTCRTRGVAARQSVEASRAIQASQASGAIRQITEILDAGRPGWWRCLHVRAAPGVGLRAFIAVVAREARLRGFVPVAVGTLGRWAGLVRLLAGVHLLLIDEVPEPDETHDQTSKHERHDLARFVVVLGLANARPNVVLVARHDSSCASPVLDVTPFGRLAVVPVLSIARSSGAAARAGRSWGVGESEHLYDAADGYDVEDPVGPGDTMSSSDHEHPDEGQPCPKGTTEFAAVDRRSDRSSARARRFASKGLVLARAGRHAGAERLLRQAVSAFSRRGERSEAGRAAFDLGQLLLERGRTRDATTAFESARGLLAPTGQTPGALRAAVFIGLAWTDEGRLVDAEAALRASRIAAEQIGDPVGASLAQLALARCLLWQGRTDEALGLVQGVQQVDRLDRVEWVETCPDLPLDQRSMARRLGARLALTRGNFRAAGAGATAALGAARALARPRELASAYDVLATVQGVIGDLDGLKRYVAEGLREARKAHTPLRALRLRVTLLEGLVRLNQRRDGRVVAARLARHNVAKVPALLRARVQLALASSSTDPTCAGTARHATEAFIRTSGARALEGVSQETPSMDVIQDLIEVLRICHESEDERVALPRVCAAVRERARASGVGLFSADVVDRPISSAGQLPSVRPLVAQRAIDTGLAIPPGQYGDGVEAAAPIRYGGRTVGALMSRWPADVSLSTGNATALLAAAAAACAPDVCAAIDRLGPEQVASRGGALELIGSGAAIDEVRRAVQRAATTSFPVLIEGDSGSGKELVARAVHRQGPRHDRTFCAVNCAAIADELFEAELFGHARGAFTGATGERAGLFEEADRGTLFLDEVSELSARAQAKLLRAIQEGEIRRVGENFARKIDARLITATNRSLSGEVAAGRFRRDLFYRVDVVRIVLPPLRERVEDIPTLANHFWRHAVAQTSSRATLDPATFAALARYDWPGNVRELQNVMTALAVSAPRRGRVGPSLLPAAIAGASPVGAARLEDARRTFEQRFVRAALARAGGHGGRAATDLGLSRQGFAKLLRRLGLRDDQG